MAYFDAEYNEQQFSQREGENVTGRSSVATTTWTDVQDGDKSKLMKYFDNITLQQWMDECNFQWFGGKLREILFVSNMKQVKLVKTDDVEVFLQECSKINPNLSKIDQSRFRLQFRLFIEAYNEYLQLKTQKEKEKQQSQHQQESKKSQEMILLSDSEKKMYDSFKKMHSELRQLINNNNDKNNKNSKKMNENLNKIEIYNRENGLTKEMNKISLKRKEILVDLLNQFNTTEKECRKKWHMPSGHDQEKNQHNGSISIDCKQLMNDRMKRFDGILISQKTFEKELKRVSDRYAKEVKQLINKFSFELDNPNMDYEMKNNLNHDDNDDNPDNQEQKPPPHDHEAEEKKQENLLIMNGNDNGSGSGIGIDSIEHGKINGRRNEISLRKARKVNINDSGDGGGVNIAINKKLTMIDILCNSKFITLMDKSKIKESNSDNDDNRGLFSFFKNPSIKMKAEEKDDNENIEKKDNKHHYLAYFRNNPLPAKRTCANVTKLRSVFIKGLREKLTFKLNQLQCQSSSTYRNGDYYINFGLIGIRKHAFLNGNGNGNSNDNNNNNNNNNDNMAEQTSLLYDFIYQYQKDLTLKRFATDIKFHKELNSVGISMKNLEILFAECLHVTKPRTCFYNIYDHTRMYKQLYFCKSDSSKNSDLTFETNDCIIMKLKFQNSKYILEIHKQSHDSKVSVKIGAFVLNCQEYDYSYVLTSACCDCTTLGNFSFEIW